MISYIDVDNKLKPVLGKSFLRVMTTVLEREDVSELIDAGKLDVSLSIVSAERIRELNNSYRDIDEPTDVLSFPMYETLAEINEAIFYAMDMEDFAVSLGDVVIAEEIALAQAEELNQSYEREVVYLFIHSLLHLCGYDHYDEADKADMRMLEKSILNSCGF